ncbi:MAG: hypothetical protein LBC85_02310, partial [Fibromonadaceae bacterium]|nr:hypothetical protein [Fibromonadaceae bacterium]
MKIWLFLFAVFVFACSTGDDKGAENSASSSLSDSSLTVVKSGSLVQIGSQIWSAENSNAEPRRGNKWCYGNFSQNCDMYGGLYDWEAANNVCPNGYRLPSKKDFDVLFDLGESRARELISATSVFNAILAGQKILDGFDQDFFIFRGERAFWWTSSDDGVREHAHCYEFNGNRLYPCTSKKISALSVRCVLNGSTMPSSSSTVASSSSSGPVLGSSSSVESSSSSSGLVLSSSSGVSSSSSVSRCGDVSSGVIYDPSIEACCDTDKYTLETHFCLEDNIVEKCGGEEYNPSTHFCLDDKVTEKCNGEPYTSIEFCFDRRIVHGRCGAIPTGDTLNPDPEIDYCCGTKRFAVPTHFCLEGVVTEKCEGKEEPYTSSQFCSVDDTILDRCGGAEYIPSTHFCLDDKVEDKCENKTKPFTSSQFCLDDKVEDKCVGRREEYTSSQFCSVDDTILDRCGGARYIPSTEFCLDDKVEDKCENKTKPFTSSQFCHDGLIILARCGGTPAGLTYNPDEQACCGNARLEINTHFCYSNNEVRGLCGGLNGEPYLANQFCFEEELVVNRCGNSFLGDTWRPIEPNKEDCCGLRRYNVSNINLRCESNVI